MGLFGPSLNEKIRRVAAATAPQAQWTIDVDWSSGSKLHLLHGVTAEAHTDAEALQLARGVWNAVTEKFRVKPDDGQDGLLDVGVAVAGGAEQRTGING